MILPLFVDAARPVRERNKILPLSMISLSPLLLGLDLSIFIIKHISKNQQKQ